MKKIASVLMVYVCFTAFPVSAEDEDITAFARSYLNCLDMAVAEEVEKIDPSLDRVRETCFKEYSAFAFLLAPDILSEIMAHLNLSLAQQLENGGVAARRSTDRDRLLLSGLLAPG